PAAWVRGRVVLRRAAGAVEGVRRTVEPPRRAVRLSGRGPGRGPSLVHRPPRRRGGGAAGPPQRPHGCVPFAAQRAEPGGPLRRAGSRRAVRAGRLPRVPLDGGGIPAPTARHLAGRGCFPPHPGSRRLICPWRGPWTASPIAGAPLAVCAPAATQGNGQAIG